MNNRFIGKLSAIGIIFLFIGVSISSGISVIDLSSPKSNVVRNCGCKRLNETCLLFLDRQLNKLKTHSKLLLLFSKDNPKLQEISEELLEFINSDGIWEDLCNRLKDFIDYMSENWPREVFIIFYLFIGTIYIFLCIYLPYIFG